MKNASQKPDFVKGDKWQDLDVTTWPVVEYFQKHVQTDGYVEHLDFTCTNSINVVLSHAYRYIYTLSNSFYMLICLYASLNLCLVNL
jgi:hypothetical protein